MKVSNTRTRTMHTCNGWPQKRERKAAMEPAHDYTVLITPFWCQEWSKSFVKGGGFGSKATCSRHHNWSKGSEFNLPDPLAISMPLCILMVSISSRNRIYIRGGKRIKNSHIHKTAFRLTPQKPFIAMSKRAPSWVLAVARANEPGSLTGCKTGSTWTWWHTSVRRQAVRSLISLCRREGRPT